MRKPKDYDHQQTSLFDFVYPSFKFTKPIRLIELFAGYGSQALALEYLGVKYESWRICEWAIPSFEAYKRIHAHDDKDYSEGMSKEELVKTLADKGVSVNWNNPIDVKQLSKKPIEYLKDAYNAMIATHNLVDISKAKGSDFAMDNRGGYQVIASYSWPCQDLSLSGKRAMMDEGSGTRSSLLWEVRRILGEMNEIGQLPDVLLAENVIQAIGEDNMENMNKWMSFLESLGYKNYFQCLEATDFGIPQTRNRFFMVSIKGDYSYQFPMPRKLNLFIKGLLEKNVDEKYYLSQDLVDRIRAWKSQVNPLEVAKTSEDEAMQTVTAKCNTTDNAMMLLLKENIDGMPIKNATEKGYLIAHDGDGVYISNIKGKRGMVQKGKIQTIKAGTDVGVVVEQKTLFTEEEARMFDEHGNVRRYIGDPRVDEFKEGQAADISYPNGYNKGPRVHDAMPAINTTTTTTTSFVTKQNWRIRKLTPRECFRFMGVKDSDIDKLIGYLANSILYHLAGDSIVTAVLMAIFHQFGLGKDGSEILTRQQIVERRYNGL